MMADEHPVVTLVAPPPVASMPLVVPRARITTSQDHANILHSQGRGRVAVARRIDGRWSECTVPLGDIGYVASQHAGETDIYLSQNRFFGRRRAIASLLQLNALFCDLDYYSLAPSIRHLRSEHVLPIALERLEEHRIPAPTVAISTGRGIALIWLHYPAPRYALSRWQACQSTIYRALSELGADPRALDAARVLRLVGTKNSKSNTLVMPLTDVGHVWVFDDLADEILPLKRADLERRRAAREKASRRRGLRSGVQPPVNFTFVTLAEGRLTDLQRLLEYRFMGMLPAGQRDEWLFCAAVSMAYLTPAAALPRELAVLAEQVAGWGEKETGARMSAVQDRARRAALGEKITYRDQKIDPRYRLRTETIIARLGITEEEMIGAELRHLVSGEIKRARERDRGARRRRAAGAVDRRIYEENSLSRLRPWETEGISRRTWERRRNCENTLATPSVASPSGCMVVKPPGGAVVTSQRAGDTNRESKRSPPSSRTAAGLPARCALQLDLFEPLGSLGNLLSDPTVAQWEACGGSFPPVLVSVMQNIARRGCPRRDLAVRAAWSRPQLSNVTRGRFGASPARAHALVESLRDLAVA